MTIGRPTSCTPEVIEMALDYISTDKEKNYEFHDHVVPSVEGMCIVINRARSRVYDWGGKEDNAFWDILKEIKSLQHFALTNKGLSGDTNSVITKLMLTKHGYVDKKEVSVNDLRDMSDEDLEREMAKVEQDISKAESE